MFQEKEKEDCGRRLGNLAVMWEAGELSYPVKSSMARLVTALHRRMCDYADQIHLALMFDHVAEVKPDSEFVAMICSFSIESFFFR